MGRGKGIAPEPVAKMSALVTVDPFSWIDQWRKTTQLFAWLSLLFQMGLSALCTFLFVTGTALVANTDVWVSIGAGMISTSVVLGTFFGISPLTRGMFFVRPAAEAKAEIESDIAITQRNPKL
jgi:hypothetical protein